MKTIGILGGMSWESTAVYYRRLNELARERLGRNSSAEVLLYSYNFDRIEKLQHAGKWKELGAILKADAQALESAGAELLLIATNTMHVLAPEIEAAIDIPLIHIADATGAQLARLGHQTVSLLGTRFTMEGEFYSARLAERFRIEVIVPEPEDREIVHTTIYEELCRGVISDASRDRVSRIIARQAAAGAQAVVLGCTELPLLVTPESSSLPILDTMELHILAAAEAAFGGA